MKELFLITTFFICVSTFVKAQRIVVANEKMNIFYAGVSNPVSIAVENTSSKAITAKATRGEIFKRDDGLYFYSDSVGRTEIIIYKKKKEIGRLAFYVESIPNPIFKIGSMRDSVPIVEISHQQYVRAEIEGLDIDAPFRVQKFTTLILSNDTCKVVRITNQGNKLSQELINEFKLLKPHDIILFKDIFVEAPWGKDIQLKEATVSVY